MGCVGFAAATEFPEKKCLFSPAALLGRDAFLVGFRFFCRSSPPSDFEHFLLFPWLLASILLSR